MELGKQGKGKLVTLYYLMLFSQLYVTFGRFVDECPGRDVMIQLQDVIDNRYSMTCKQRCGQAVEVKDKAKEVNKNLNAYATTSCSCDALCYVFNDCCHNFEEMCKGEVDEFTRIWKTFPTGIVKYTKDGNKIATCRKGCTSEPNHMIRKDCLNKSYNVISMCVGTKKPCAGLNIHDPNRFIPVYDQNTKLHYTNLECAKCNGAGNLRPWKYQIKCHDLNAKENLVPDNITSSLESNNCSIEVEPDENMKGLRECFRNMETSCPDSCDNKELVDKCENGSSCFASANINKSHIPHLENETLKFPIIVNYKNYFCGLCNGVPPDAIQCGNLYANVSILRSRPRNYVSLTTLFEFNVDVGFFFGSCPEGSLAIKHVCVNIPSQADLTFTYNLKSGRILSGGDKYEVAVEQSYYNETFEQANAVFKRSDIDPIGTEITLEPYATGDVMLNISIRVVLNIQSSDTLLRCLESVEQKLRSIVQHISKGHIFNQFSVSVTFENDDNLLDMDVEGIPTHCVIVNQSNIDLNFISVSSLDVKTEMVNGVEMKCFYKSKDNSDDQLNHLDFMTYVCVCLSIICLSIRICMQCYVPHFRSGPGRMQFNLTLALLLAFLAWFVGSFVVDHPSVCQIFAVVRYFAFMAAFAWMTNIAVDTWRLFRPNAQLISPDETTTPLLMYHLCGWLGTLILSGFVFMFDFLDVPTKFKPNFGPPYCWITGKSLIIYFFIPTGILLLTNITLFICTSVALRASFQESSAVVKKDKRNFQVYAKLFLLMGITWTLGFVVAFTDVRALEYVFIFANSLQGVFIFIAFVCTKRTFAHFVRKYRFYSMSSSKRSNTGSTPVSTSKSQ